MDAKITLSFNKNVIQEAKDFAHKNDISLSRLTEFIYRQMTSKSYQTLEDLPISDWVNMVAEGKSEYVKRPSGKKMNSDFFESRK